MSFKINFLIKHFIIPCLVFISFSCKNKQSSSSNNEQAYNDLQAFKLNKYTTFNFPKQFEKQHPFVIKEIYSRSLNSQSLKKNAITFQIDSSSNLKRKLYKIEQNKDTLFITSKIYKGLIHSIQDLLYRASKNSIPVNTLDVRPALDFKALHFVIRKNKDISTYKKMIDLSWQNGYNTLIIQLRNSINFDTLKSFDRRNIRYSKQDISQIINYAKAYGFEVIPEVKLLTKQQKTFDFTNKSLLHNEKTYNPNNPNVYKHVFALIDEILAIDEFNYFHIGHDEVYGSDTRRKKVKALNQSSFVKDVITINDYLKRKNVKTMMWADMLWDREKFKIPQAGVKYLKGYEDAINHIPKDIILCDWHYRSNSKDFPTYKYFVDLGFETWGVTWDNFEVTEHFTDYIINTPSPFKKGLIVTTWHRSNKEIENIIKTSADIFKDE